jgi:hypothetical protein
MTGARSTRLSSIIRVKVGVSRKAEPDVQSDPYHDDAEPKRHAPSPVEKLIAGDPTEQQHHHIGEKQPGRTAPLRP